MTLRDTAGIALSWDDARAAPVLKAAGSRADRWAVITGTDVGLRARPTTPWPTLEHLTDGELIQQLPTGLVVVDRAGIVRDANPAMLATFGVELDDLVGRSVLHLVDGDDVTVLAEVLADREHPGGEAFGLAPIRFVDATGRRRSSVGWVRRLEDRSGFLLVLPATSVSDALADAARSLGRAESFESVVEHIVAGIRAHPLAADGCVVRFGDGATPVTPWPLGDDLPTDGDLAASWWATARDGTGFDLDLEDDSGAASKEHGPLRRLGYRSVWCRPVVDGRGLVAGAVVVFHTADGLPSHHQRRALDDVVAATTMAVDQCAYRATIRGGAFVDPLTGVGSRARLHEEIASGIEGSAVVHLDLDGFGALNDHYGRDAGDEVLREVADRLTSILRADDLVIRVGGDEFVLVIRAVSEFDGVRIAARIVDELARPYALPNGGTDGPLLVPATASVGLCVQCDGTPLEDALVAADEALSSAKRDGKRRMHIVSR